MLTAVLSAPVLTPTSARSAAQSIAAAPTASVIICAYTPRRWVALLAAVASVERQTQLALETIVVIDHSPELLERARATLTGARVIENEGEHGLSAARNTGLKISRAEIVAFLDDDAIAEEKWLEELCRAYKDPRVIGVGGVARPRWEADKAPPWLPQEFYWAIGCSYRGLPTRAEPIRNPIGATMSFRRTVFDQVGGFRNGLGRVGRTPLGCEETELSIRARQAYPGGVVLHVPAARVEHLVPAERASWRYFRSRCWAEGLSKAIVTDEVGPSDGLSSEWTYTLKTLPTGILRGLLDSARGDLTGLQRSSAIVAGLFITLAGYLRARAARAIAS
ncbi:MAG TPA: glycosyltransferase family 2 protein [Solirubrobacterales bacterium]|nr:glycosyltransferase family 2 protein [Solirubrobacterales bacterium]